MQSLPIELRDHIKGYLLMPLYDYHTLRNIYAWLCGVHMVNLVMMCKRLDITHTHTGQYLITSYHKTKINVNQRKRVIICNIMRWCVHTPVFNVIDMIEPMRNTIIEKMQRASYKKAKVCDCCMKGWGIPNELGLCQCICSKCKDPLSECRYVCQYNV